MLRTPTRHGARGAWLAPLALLLALLLLAASPTPLLAADGDGDESGEVEDQDGSEGAEEGDGDGEPPGGEGEPSGEEGEEGEPSDEEGEEGEPSDEEGEPGVQESGLPVGVPYPDGPPPEGRPVNIAAPINQGVGARAGFLGLHPTYKLVHTRDQDVAGWNHSFNLSRGMSRRIKFTAGSTINISENEVLNRVNRNENWNAGLSVAVSPAVSMGIKFVRSFQQDIRNEGEANEVRSFREKESVRLSSDYQKTHLNGIDVTAGVTAGLEKNEYADVRNTGLTQGITGTIRYAPIPTFRTTIGYNGGHSLMDSRQGALESTDQSSQHMMTGRAEYDWSTHKIAVDLRRLSSNKEYPKAEQTERRDQIDQSATVRGQFKFLEAIDATLSYAHSQSRTLYELEATRDSDVANRTVDASLAYKLGETKYTAELKSEKKRNEYFNFQSGDVYHQTLGGSASHNFTSRFGLVARGRMSLLSYQYDDVDENDQDRDLFDREATLSLTYKPRVGIDTGLVLRVKQNELIYIRRSRTGDNKTTQKYSILPSISKVFGSGLKVTQRYELTADYTFYDYDRDSNFLIRGVVISTGVSWSPLGGLALSVEHKHRSQDEGAYVEDEDGVERYGKNSEREDKSINIKVGYRLLGAIDVEVTQNYSLRTKWSFEDDQREFAWEKFDTRLTGKASLNHDLGGGTKINATVARTLRDATSITERQKDVWKITANVSKAF